MDSTVRQNIQKGNDPMDIGYTDFTGYEYEDQHVHMVGGKGRVCWTCGHPDHVARMCPKGKGKGKSGSKG